MAAKRSRGKASYCAAIPMADGGAEHRATKSTSGAFSADPNISTEQADNSRTSNTEMITISRAEYEALQAELAEQKQQLESKSAELESKSAELAAALLQNQWLQEQLLLKKKKIFGTSSEQIDQMVIEQFAYLFNEAEGWDRDSYVSAIKVEAHSRKRRSGSITDAVPEGRP